MEKFSTQLFYMLIVLFWTNSGECCLYKSSKPTTADRVSEITKQFDWMNAQQKEDKLEDVIRSEKLEVIKGVFEHKANGMPIFKSLEETQKLNLLRQAIQYRDPPIVEYLITIKERPALLSELENRQHLIGDFYMDTITAVNENETEAFRKMGKNMEVVFQKQAGVINTPFEYDQQTLLHKYVQQEYFQHHLDLQLEMLTMLVDNNANVNARNNEGYTPLHNAVKDPNIRKDSQTIMKIIRLLISHGADSNAKNVEGDTFLRLAASDSPAEFPEIVRYLASVGKTDSFKSKDDHDVSVLHAAVSEFVVANDTLQILKTHGANINGVDNKGNSVLFYAIDKGHNETFLRTLIGFGADWRIRNNMGQTALHRAVSGTRNLAAVKLLILLGSDVNAADNLGQTPLHTVLHGERTDNQLDIIKELMENGANPNYKDKWNQSPIEFLESGFDFEYPEFKRRAKEIMQQ